MKRTTELSKTLYKHAFTYSLIPWLIHLCNKPHTFSKIKPEYIFPWCKIFRKEFA